MPGMNTFKCSLLVALASAAVSAAAQFVGPGATTPYKSVAEVIKSAPDDARVELVGYILRQVGKEKYIFSDGHSEIRIEIDSKYMPAERIDEKTRIRILGEVEKDFLETPEIDVDSVSLLR